LFVFIVEACKYAAKRVNARMTFIVGLNRGDTGEDLPDVVTKDEYLADDSKPDTGEDLPDDVTKDEHLADDSKPDTGEDLPDDATKDEHLADDSKPEQTGSTTEKNEKDYILVKVKITKQRNAMTASIGHLYGAATALVLYALIAGSQIGLQYLAKVVPKKIVK
ncbi:hypothetical protein ADUPG1_000258, partial [Aduncisulcus paluster]